MGKAIWGTSGGFQGKNGANIGRWVEGQNQVGPLPHPSQKPATTGQISSRAKFTFLTSFVNRIAPLVKTGLAFVLKPRQSAVNAAFEDNYANVTGVYPAFTMNYPGFLFSKGLLSVPASPEVEAAVAAQVEFNWLASFNEGYGAATDTISVMIYNPAKDQFVFKTAAALRSALTYTLMVPADFSGDLVHCYVSAVAADGERVSNSYYTASVTVM